MTTITLASGHTIETSIEDVVIHDRVGFLDMTKTVQKRTARVWNAAGVYQHGLALPLVELSLDEAEAIQQIEDRIDEVERIYKRMDVEWQAQMKRLGKS